jgi:hypothetical protein
LDGRGAICSWLENDDVLIADNARLRLPRKGGTAREHDENEEQTLEH